MNLNELEIIRLTDEYKLEVFDCGNPDLNDFLLSDSKDYLRQFMSVTYLICKGEEILAYFSVSNDRISSEDLDSKTQWRKLQGCVPHTKRWMKNFPAVKIGRFAVCQGDSRQGLGTQLMDYIKLLFFYNNKTGCRFILVDSLRTSIRFYEKQGFLFLSKNDENEKTRLMYFDLKSFASLEE